MLYGLNKQAFWRALGVLLAAHLLTARVCASEKLTSTQVDKVFVLSCSERSAEDVPRNGVGWDELEASIRAHRNFVRMCGPLSAARMMHGLGSVMPGDYWRRCCASVEPQGVLVRKVLAWCQAADSSVQAIQCRSKNLKDCLSRLRLPCILIVNESRHCLVLEQLDRNTGRARIWDPSDLSTKQMMVEQVLSMWDGAAIIAGPVRWTNASYGLLHAGVFATQLFGIWRLLGSRRSPKS